MKTILILFFSLSITYANHVKWYGNYDNALKQAKAENKDLIVFLIKNNCKQCKNIVAKIFTNQSYIDKINKNFISVIVNIDDKHSYPREMYWSNEYPTLFFVNSKNEIFLKSPIYKVITKKEIQKIIEDLCKK
jgi:thioredoxin-related protein